MLRLENLTAHQAEVYEKLKNKTRVDLRAPAGEEICFHELEMMF